jgi:hypothetical protein
LFFQAIDSSLILTVGFVLAKMHFAARDPWFRFAKHTLFSFVPAQAGTTAQSQCLTQESFDPPPEVRPRLAARVNVCFASKAAKVLRCREQRDGPHTDIPMTAAYRPAVNSRP